MIMADIKEEDNLNTGNEPAQELKTAKGNNSIDNSKKERVTNLILIIITSIAGTVSLSLSIVYFSTSEWYIKYSLYAVAGGLLLLGFLFYFFNRRSLFRLTFTLTVTMVFLMAGYALLDILGFFTRFSSPELIKNFILSTGMWGMVVYLGIQLLQVMILPLPSWIFYAIGTQIFGPTIAFLLSTLGVTIGSVLSFLLGRIFGKKLVYWISGKEDAEKYRSLLERGKFFFIIMLILPFFPDDILCLVAGITSMSFRFFMISILTIRPIVIAVYCYVGELIPLKGWGLWVWLAIFVVLGVAFVLTTIYRERIEKFFGNFKFGKKRRNNKKSPPDVTEG